LRDHMQVELRQLQQKLRITTILVTHDQREAMTISDSIVVMGNGVVQQMGSPTEIYRNPANRFVASFIGQSNLLDVEILDATHVRADGHVLSLAAGSKVLHPGARASLLIRPEDIRSATAEAVNVLPCHVVFVRDIGASVELHVECGRLSLIAIATAGTWPALSQGDPVALALPADRCRIMLDAAA
jgi:putative spermidine/putrescine transport system ATP-binding protein